MATPQRNNLVYGTSCVLFVGSFLQWRQDKNSAKKGASNMVNHPLAIRGYQHSLPAQWLAIGVLSIVLAFTMEEVPDFGGPLTLLVLIVALLKYASVFGATFNETQGKTK